MTDGLSCRLCGGRPCTPVHDDGRRRFFRCAACSLIFVPACLHLTAQQEKTRYELHDNDGDNAGYRQFLSGLLPFITDSARMPVRVLDYGSGPNRVLAALLKERGVACESYDPLFGIAPADPGVPFDVVVLCEVIEHVRELPGLPKLLRDLLCKQGRIVIRTRVTDDVPQFGSWWYMQDPTHINFFSARSLGCFARMTGGTLETTVEPDVFLIRIG